MIHAITDGTSARGNEDRFGYAANAAWVLDGATDISRVEIEGRTAAWWLVEAYQAELHNLSSGSATGDAFAMMGMLSARVRDRLHTKFGSEPRPVAAALAQASTALSLVRKVKGRWNILSLADCPVLYRDPSTGQTKSVSDLGFTRFERRSLAALQAAQHREPGAGLSRLAELARPVLQQNRACMNAEDGYAIGAIRPPPRKLVFEYRMPEGVEAFAILSDGFSRWYDVFGLGTMDEMFARIETGAAHEVLAELRHAERSDPEGRRYLRFKTHDDATCLFARTEEL